MPEDVESTLKTAIADFSATFKPTEEAAGSAVAAGPGTLPDEAKKDVGWDVVSSVDGDGETDAPASE